MKRTGTITAGVLLAFAIALAVSGIFYAGPATARSLFDTDDEPLFEEDEIQVPAPVHVQADSALDRFMKDATITLGYRFSHGMDNPANIIDHHLFTRLEYDTLAGENLYVKLDAKTSVHPPNDDLADTKDKELFVDGSIRELYIQPGFDAFNLTFGKQISVWGKADTAAVTDVLSPRDFSRFIFVKLEDARFGQWMASANIYSNLFNTFVFISPYPGRDREPDDGSRYYRPLPGEDRFDIQKDDLEFGDLEFGFKLDKSFSKTDTSLMAGRFYANAALFNPTGAVENGRSVLEKTYPDYFMAGAAATHTWQSFLFKLELAYKNDFPLQGLSSRHIYKTCKKEIIDSAIGLEYDANSRYKISLELSNRYIASGTGGLIPGTDENSSALYTTFFKDFLNQTLEFEYIFYHHIQEKNQYHQFRLTDNIELKAEYTVLNVKDSQSMIYSYRDEDRIGLEIRYFF